MTAHTSGPWHIEVTHVTDGAFTICHGVNKHHDGPAGTVGKVYCSVADARLMAAAPDLLEALNAMLGSIIPYRHDGTPTIPDAVIEKVNAALAKATGNAP